VSDRPRLEGWFRAGKLLRPDYETPSTVHLARALAALCGVDLDLETPTRRLAGLIGEARHYVFFLADGLGMNLVESLPRSSFLHRHTALELRSLFPSSTAPALTSLATGAWPATHAVVTWFQYLPRWDVQATVLPFVERFSGEDLRRLGLGGEQVFTTPALAPRFRRDVSALMPAPIAESVYTRYMRGGTPVQGYGSLEEALAALAARLSASDSPSYTYVYYSRIDGATHAHGPASREVAAEVDALEGMVAQLHESLAARARIILTSDHGAIEVPAAKKLELAANDPLLDLLRCVPSGEPLVPLLHAREGQREAAFAAFRRRFGEAFAWLSVDEAEELRLLGPGPLAAATRERLGDYLGLSAEGMALVYGGDEGIRSMRGFHGGLSRDEVRTPLVLA
jgi:hypothetical protein